MINRGAEAHISLGGNSRWYPPIEDFWKMNSDAACFEDPLMTSIEMIYRDFEGRLWLLLRVMDIKLEAHLAELWTILECIRLVVSLGCSKLIVESDCQIAIKFINKEIEAWSDSEALVATIWIFFFFACFQRYFL